MLCMVMTDLMVIALGLGHLRDRDQISQVVYSYSMLAGPGSDCCSNHFRRVTMPPTTPSYCALHRPSLTTVRALGIALSTFEKNGGAQPPKRTQRPKPIINSRTPLKQRKKILAHIKRLRASQGR